jgi:hypothetical protein
VTKRRRVLLVIMAAVVAWTVIPYMVRHVGMVKALAPAAPLCAAGQSEGCVGGTVQIISVPAAKASDAGR